MELQISSGQGPVECEIAVAKLAQSLCKEFSGTAIKQITNAAGHGYCPFLESSPRYTFVRFFGIRYYRRKFQCRRVQNHFSIKILGFVRHAL